MSKETIIVGGQPLWFDFELFKKQQEYYDKKEKDYLEYVMSGRQCEDIFGKGNCPHRRREHDGSVGEI